MTRPQYEHEVVRKRHENANMGQIVGAACQRHALSTDRSGA